jgi:hypothetical protein
MSDTRPRNTISGMQFTYDAKGLRFPYASADNATEAIGLSQETGERKKKPAIPNPSMSTVI